MRRSIPASLTLAAAFAAALSGCDGPRPFVREGDATSVEVGVGGDIAGATPVARRHCAQFERVPRLVGPTLDGAIFDCVRPGEGS